MKTIILMFMAVNLFANYPNTLAVWEVFQTSFTQTEIDNAVSSATALTAELPQPAQRARYYTNEGKALMAGDIVIDRVSIFSESGKVKLWAHYGFDSHGFIRDENFDKMREAFDYLYYVEPSSGIILGEEYEIDGATYTAEGSTAPASGESFVIEGETYTYVHYLTGESTSVIIGDYSESKGGWLTNIAGVIVFVISGVVYFLRKKDD